MWLIYQSLFGFEGGGLTAYGITMATIFVASLQVVDNQRLCLYGLWQIPGSLIWTDVLNMVALGLEEPAMYWWAYGWTLSLVPVLGGPLIASVTWCIVWMLFGPSVWQVAFTH